MKCIANCLHFHYSFEIFLNIFFLPITVQKMICLTNSVKINFEWKNVNENDVLLFKKKIRASASIALHKLIVVHVYENPALTECGFYGYFVACSM